MTSPLGDETVIHTTALSVQNDRIHGSLTLSALVRDNGHFRTVTIVLPADAVPALMASVANQGAQLLVDAAEAWRRGDCTRCRNTRMIEAAAAGGRTRTEHCPDCRGAEGTDALRGFPTVA